MPGFIKTVFVFKALINKDRIGRRENLRKNTRKRIKNSYL